MRILLSLGLAAVMVSLILTNVLPVSGQEIQVSTPPIIIPVTKPLWGGIPPLSDLSIDVRTLGPGPVKVEAYATDLFEERGRSTPIGSSALGLSIVTAQTSNLTVVKISLSLPNDLRSGSYKGKIVISTPNSQPQEVAISIVVNDSPWWALIAVLSGVGLSFLYFFAREVNDLRENLRQVLIKVFKAFEEVERALTTAVQAENIDQSYMSARSLYIESITRWNEDVNQRKSLESYEDILLILERAKRQAEQAQRLPNPPSNANLLAFPTLQHGPSERLKKSKVRDLVQQVFFLQYLGLTVAFVIIALSAWQGFIANIAAFGASGPLDYAAAVIYGYGSQAALSQGVGLAKSWIAGRGSAT